MTHARGGIDADSSGHATRHAAERVARHSYGKLVAFLAARSHDVAAAEDALADAFAAALAEWPRGGCPDHPEAWLLTVARRKLIDVARRRLTGEKAIEQWLQLADDTEAANETTVPDHRLALMFACAHPAIEDAVHAPLMLQAVLGLDAKRIASAFLTSPAAMSKRLVRAKEKIRAAGIPFRTPEPEELAERLGGVLDAIYAAFNDGWSAPGGLEAARCDLVEEAIFLARLVAELAPREPEALGLLACLLHAHARRHARRDADGEYVPLAVQDTSRWDGTMIAEAEALLRRAIRIGAIGRYQLEAAVQSAHADRRRCGRVDWHAVLQLYDGLYALTGSPVVAINRALALAESSGPDAALATLPEVTGDARLATYQPYWAVRANLLARIGATPEAHAAYEIAIGLEGDAAVRRFLRHAQSKLEN